MSLCLCYNPLFLSVVCVCVLRCLFAPVKGFRVRQCVFTCFFPRVLPVSLLPDVFGVVDECLSMRVCAAALGWLCTIPRFSHTHSCTLRGFDYSQRRGASECSVGSAAAMSAVSAMSAGRPRLCGAALSRTVHGPTPRLGFPSPPRRGVSEVLDRPVDAMKIASLLRAFRNNGHLLASVDPLGLKGTVSERDRVQKARELFSLHDVGLLLVLWCLRVVVALDGLAVSPPVCLGGSVCSRWPGTSRWSCPCGGWATSLSTP